MKAVKIENVVRFLSWRESFRLIFARWEGVQYVRIVRDMSEHLQCSASSLVVFGKCCATKRCGERSRCCFSCSERWRSRCFRAIGLEKMGMHEVIDRDDGQVEVETTSEERGSKQPRSVSSSKMVCSNASPRPDHKLEASCALATGRWREG